MPVINESWTSVINICLAALPVIGALLFLNIDEKRELKRRELGGILCIIWGFLIYVAWQSYQLPIDKPTPFIWWEGVILPVVMAFILTVGIIKINIKRKRHNKQNPSTPKE
jgi:hypothetical protein